jgi:hypothetical protein
MSDLGVSELVRSETAKRRDKVSGDVTTERTLKYLCNRKFEALKENIRKERDLEGSRNQFFNLLDKTKFIRNGRKA